MWLRSAGWVVVGLATASLVTPAGARGIPDAPGQQAAASARLEQMALIEREDFGVVPTAQLHDGPMHATTPATIPGGQTLTTRGLVDLLQNRQVPHVLLDVLGGQQALPGAVPAVWMSEPGSYADATQRRVEQTLAQLTHGRKDTVLVLYCLSRECWMSYNASLRAIHAGYRNVLWYRGGIEAWAYAGLPTAAPGQAGAAGPMSAPAGGYDAQARGVFEPVTPAMPAAPARSAPARSPGALRIGQTQFFSFAQPEGWRIGEQGQYALTQVSPDNRALTVMVGNAGFPANYPPARFAFERLTAMQPQNLQLGPGRPASPVAGFGQAVEFEVAYVAQGVPYRGLARVSVAPAYDTATMALTAALAPADQWSSYASWLPQIASLVSATDGAAFGRRGIMQQNLRNSVAFGQAAQQYREWSQANWQGVVDQRNRSVDERNFAVRENLGGVQTYSNPYGTTPPVEMPMSHKYYWVNQQGQMVGTDDPGADPNVGSTAEWRRMERVGR